MRCFGYSVFNFGGCFKQCRIQIPQPAVGNRQMVNQTGAYGNFYPFNAAEKNQAKFTVEIVAVQYVFKTGAGMKQMQRCVALHVPPIIFKTVVTNILQTIAGLCFVFENHAALFEQCNLVGNRVRRFVHIHKKMSRARSYGMATTSVGAKVRTFLYLQNFGQKKSGNTAYQSIKKSTIRIIK